LAALLGLGLFLRLSYSLQLPNQLLIPDAGSFDTIAWNVASQGEYAMEGRPTAYRPPSYVLFLAAIYKIFGHHYRAVRIAQGFMGIGQVLLLIKIAQELRWNSLIQWTVGGIAACYPFFIYYESHLISDAYLTFWHTAALLSVLRWHHHLSSVSRAALMGFCFAVLCLLKSVFMPLFILVIALEAFLSRRAFPWKALLAAALVFALPLFAWGLRNEKTFGRFFLDGHGGRTLVETIVYHDRVKDGTFPELWANDPLQKQTASMDEAARDAFFSDYVKKYILTHPGLYAKQSFERFKDLWRFYPRQDVRFSEGRRMITLISLLTEPFLILAGIFGLFKSRRQWRELYPSYAALLLLTAAHTLITGQMRYRLPLMPILILFASYAVIAPKNRPSHY
jgi:4-amino-4-deoxy-L-arabinose transferase-like glycosyltransferase